MKKIDRWIKPILCFTMLALLASCARVTVYRPNDSTVQNMSVKEARKVLVTELKRKEICYEGICCGLQPKFSQITDVRVTWDRLIVTDANGKQSIFIFKELPDIVIENVGACFDFIMLSSKPEVSIIPSGGDSTIAGIVNAFYVVQQYPIKAKREADEYDANVAVSLADYRKKAASNAALPEEANRYKVQAEGAVRDKQPDEAADLYADALKIAPWWPVGHFNRALILGETGDYKEAKREMKRYLQLVPDAPNARAAQDKIYDWERLEAK